jgi:hypothetical protein
MSNFIVVAVVDGLFVSCLFASMALLVVISWICEGKAIGKEAKANWLGRVFYTYVCRILLLPNTITSEIVLMETRKTSNLAYITLEPAGIFPDVQYCNS